MSTRTITLGETTEFTLVGLPIIVGQKAPRVSGRTRGFGTLGFDIINDTSGKTRVLNFVSSVNTGICDTQVRHFNAQLQDNDAVAVVTISADLPFMLDKWCGVSGLEGAIMVSDHFDMAIGNAYGTHIKELRLEQRAVIVVDVDGLVQYTEYCPRIDMHPDYEAALNAVHALL